MQLPERQHLLNEHLHDLERLTHVFNEFVVIITNQVLSKPNIIVGNPTIPAGGNIVSHACTTRIVLKKGKGDQRIAKIIDAPYLPEGEAIFCLSENGIGDNY
ncbi:MAG: hypothetical protein ACFFAO_13810 [Candidatus Hermodarchaeota archaeon]